MKPKWYFLSLLFFKITLASSLKFLTVNNAIDEKLMTNLLDANSNIDDFQEEMLKLFKYLFPNISMDEYNF